MARRKNKSFIILFFVLVIAAGVGITQLNIFEQNKPEIDIPDHIYSNLVDPIVVRVADKDSNLKNIKVTLKKDINDVGAVLWDSNIQNKKDINLQIPLPKVGFKEKVNSYVMEIEASDSSFWNFFAGNKATKIVSITVDNKKPNVQILSNSYQIEQGGAASVVFEAKDENLAELYIEDNKGKKFKVTPYIKEGYYVALIAWDAREEQFRAYVVASDKAGNITKERIRYYLTNRKYRVSNISLTDRFLDGKIEDLANQYAPQGSNFDRLQKFKFVNETLRLSDEETIHKITSEIPEEKIEHNIKFNLFTPLKNSMKVADFADHRYYHYEGKFVSDSYHMGLDLASVARDNIIANNDGKVVFAEENGIYGLNIIIYHGLGVYTLYGHCSSKDVEVGDTVHAKDIVANTGVSGLALGDHLHFGVLVQGIETRPEQWQDVNWMNNNIYKVLEDGKKIILGEIK
ncbi:M23 family metallopeptidase [Campylobacter sp. US33a]|uniref:M23 family metallopeptidase n=1 Tax=Campylobacter sp. US33a TaxID=2498120 RepID=UPI001068365B|nr:M23 family metallopeptidase [Campylobacter sp. US33a]TEY03145.1 M23 family metallopeptidase [Campylobacter sp. US33a]